MAPGRDVASPRMGAAGAKGGVSGDLGIRTQDPERRVSEARRWPLGRGCPR